MVIQIPVDLALWSLFEPIAMGPLQAAPFQPAQGFNLSSGYEALGNDSTVLWSGPVPDLMPSLSSEALSHHAYLIASGTAEGSTCGQALFWRHSQPQPTTDMAGNLHG